MRKWVGFAICGLLLGVIPAWVFAAEDDGVLADLNKRIAESPKDPMPRTLRAQRYSELGKHAEAIADLDVAIRLSPDAIELVDFRGSERLSAGQFREALEDFDQYLKKRPEQAPYHWKRGIALYYAGRYADGVRQFDLHQKVNSADVENAVWRFLCMAKRDGVPQARHHILQVGPDPRVPMSEIYDVFAGKATIADVLRAAKASEPSADERRNRLFYAHLYVGLYLDSLGKQKEAREHLRLAATEYFVNHYMGRIAKVHLATISDPPGQEKP